MRTILPEPPKPSDPRFIDWLYRLWKRVTSTSSGELGLGTMADQDADAVAITGGTASLDQVTVTQNDSSVFHAIRVNRTFNDGAGSKYGVVSYNYATDTTSATRFSAAVSAQAYPLVNSGITNSGYCAAANLTAYRNLVATDSDDDGTLVNLYGFNIQLGHYNTNTSANPQTTSVFGSRIAMVCAKGTILDASGMYVFKNTPTGGTFTTIKALHLAIASGDGTTAYNIYAPGTAQNHFSGDVNIFGAGKLGYAAGSGGTVTQATSRTTGVTLNKTNGAITLVSAAGSATWQSFTLTNSTIAATDTVRVCQKSGTDLYQIHVTAVAAGSCQITYATTGGTTTEQPVFNFAVLKGVTS